MEVENENESLNERLEGLESKLRYLDSSTNQFKEKVQQCVHKLMEHNVSSTQIPNVIQTCLGVISSTQTAVSLQKKT